MPAPGSVWAPNTWSVDAWAANTWADSVEPPDVVPNVVGSVYMTRARMRRRARVVEVVASVLAWLIAPTFA